MAVRLFNIETGDGRTMILDHQLGRFCLTVIGPDEQHQTIALTLPELKALHERLGEVLWDVSAGRIKVEE